MMTPDTADQLRNTARQAGVRILVADGTIDAHALEVAKEAFCTEENFDARMRAALKAYLRAVTEGGAA